MQDAVPAPRFRLRPVPLLVTLVLAVGIPFLAAGITNRFLGKAALHDGLLAWLYVHHAFQLVLALAAIAVVRRFVPADYGLHMPRGRSYVGPALLWGLAFGVLMLLVDYAPQLRAGTAPRLDYPLTTATVAGWLGFEGIYVGPTEEIPFRALIVTYLAATMPGRLRIGAYEMNWAGVIAALIFALLHASNFASRPWPLALGQQVYAFALGVLYAYWLEKSNSVLAPAIGHNAGDVTEQALLFLWVALAG